MKRVRSVAPTRHLLALVGLAFAATVGSLSAADHYYVNDHLATTTAVTDAAGEIAAIEADAFGTPVTGAAQAARFTGKPYDDDIGAYVFPFRNYRSDEARWLSADPSGFPDGSNARAYITAIFNLIDPWGLASVTVYAYGPNSTSNTGHAWTNVTTDDGLSTTLGSYPSGLVNDANTVPEVQHTFEVTDAQAKAASAAQSNPGPYTKGGNNCVDAVISVLGAANISHPDFDTFFISNPSNVKKWINGLNKKE